MGFMCPVPAFGVFFPPRPGTLRSEVVPVLRGQVGGVQPWWLPGQGWEPSGQARAEADMLMPHEPQSEAFI